MHIIELICSHTLSSQLFLLACFISIKALTHELNVYFLFRKAMAKYSYYIFQLQMRMS